MKRTYAHRCLNVVAGCLVALISADVAVAAEPDRMDGPATPAQLTLINLEKLLRDDASPHEEDSIIAEIRLGTWVSDWNFDVRTASDEFSLKGNLTLFVSPSFEFLLNDRFSVKTAYEFHLGPDLTAHVVDAGIAWRIDLGDGTPKDYEQAQIEAGISYGTLDVTLGGFPGDFDNAFGLYAGATYLVWIGERWELNLGLHVRWMEFNYNESAGVLDADSSLGGFGVLSSVHLVGISFRF